MDTDGGHPARPEPVLADGLSLGDSGEITFTTQAGDVVSAWVGPSRLLHVDIESAADYGTFTEAELALLKAACDHVRTFGTWNHQRPGEHYEVVR